MIKKLLILFLISLPVYAQQDQSNGKDNQSVELPEFVITGVERVNLPVVTKPKADLVPMLGESFFKPEIPTEELKISELSNPIKKDIKFFDPYTNLNGNLILGGGIHTLPVGNFYFGKAFEHSLVSATIWGIKEIPDTTFSAKNNSGISLNTSFFVNDSSGFLPGAKFSIGGSYNNQEFYKFYESSISSRKRNIRNADILLGIQDLLNNNFKFGINGLEKVTYLKDESLTENNLGLNGFIESYYKDFSFDVRFKYQNQFIYGDSIDNNRKGYLEGSVIMGLKTPDLFKLKFGLNFSYSRDDKPILPYVYMGYKIDNFLSAFVEYNPHADYITISDLLGINKYSNIPIFNFIQKNQGGLTLAVKYEYYTYFEIDGGLKYDMFSRYLYFKYNDKYKGFDPDSAKASNYGAFINFLFHLGPYGSFYGGITYNNFKYLDESHTYLNEKQMPYVAPLNIKLNYSYDVTSRLKIESGLDFYSRRYSDLANTKKINQFADLSLKLNYEISKNFYIFSNLTNILNNENYMWAGNNPEDKVQYLKGKPFDVVFGINYIW